MLPENIKNSKFLHPGEIELLESVGMPVVDASFEDDTLKNIIQYYSLTPDEMDVELHKYAAALLAEGKVNEAWQVLLVADVV